MNLGGIKQVAQNLHKDCDGFATICHEGCSFEQDTGGNLRKGIPK